MLIKKHITYLSYLFVLSAQILLAVAVFAIPAQAQSPVGWWKFDDGSGTMAADSSGNAHTALLSSGVSWVGGTNARAISANAANQDFVNIPAIDLSGTRAVTIAFWANRIYSTGGDDVLFEATRNYQNSTTGFVVLPDDYNCHGIQAALRGNEGTTANCYSQPSSGVWHHLALVFDKSQTGGNEVAFYIDGVLQTPSWNVSASTNTNSFGNEPIYVFSRGGISQFSSGTMDDLRIYNRALTAVQIQQIYDGSGLASPSGSTINYVQGNYATPQTPQTTVNVTFTAAQVAGNLNVVVVGWHDRTATVSAVSDSTGNLYAPAVGPTVIRALSQSIYYAKNIASASAGGNSVTVTFSGAAVRPDIRILEYSGADPANPVDVTATNSGRSTSSNSGSATTTNATDLIFGANIVAATTTGPGSGFTQRLLTSPDGDIAEDQMVTDTGSYSATAPIMPIGRWIMQMVAFRAAANFTISASPTSLSIAQGSPGTSTITTAISGGFSSSISLSATGVPTGTTVSFDPSPIPAPGAGSSTMTITVGLNTPTGTYPITVTGTGGSTQHTVAVNLTVTTAVTTINYVQGNYATPQTPQTTVNVTFSAAQVAGDLNVVAVGWNDSIATVSAVTDSTGNVYAPAVGPTIQSGLASQSIYYAKNIASAAFGANVVSVTFSSAAVSPDIRILEYSGADPNNPVDVTAANSGNSTSSSSGSATTTSALDLIFSANLVQTGTTGPGSGFTTRMLTQPDGDIAEDQMVAATGSYSATAPVSPSGPWIMQMVAFRTPGQPVLVSIAVTPANPSITAGGQQQFTATGTYSDGSHQDLTNSATWTSSIPSVATISGTGLATGVAVGTTTIQATSGSIYGTTTLTVTATGNFTISASPSSLTIGQGSPGTSTITTAVSGGFSSSISLSATGAPTGTTVSFNPSMIPAPGSGSSTMIITVGASTPVGTYPITVTGNGVGSSKARPSR
jgi:hypothetical protein